MKYTSDSSQTRGDKEDTPERAECQYTGTAQQSNYAPGQNPLLVTPRCQEGFYSCWSTSAEMILEFLGGGRVRQCDQANQSFNYYDCCGGNNVLRAGRCDLPSVPDFGQWGYDCDYVRTPLSWSQVTGEIDAGRPFAFALARPIPPGPTAVANAQTIQISHMMVAIGYGVHPQSGVQVVITFDPSPVLPTQTVMVPFTVYNGSSGDYTHAEDYFRIRPKM